MAKSDYLDPRWQKFRLERLSIANWRCECCASKEDTLHVHHAFYISGRKPWEYLPETTLVLCEECHEIAHDFGSAFEDFGGDRWEHQAAVAIAQSLPHNGYKREDVIL